MDIENFFRLPSSSASIFPKGSVGSYFVDELDAAQIVFIGIEEYRNPFIAEEINSQIPELPDFITTFKGLQASIDFPSMYDCGTFISGKTVEDSLAILGDIFLTLAESNKIPIVVGGRADLLLTYVENVSEHKKINVQPIIVDSYLSFDVYTDKVSEKNYLHALLEHEHIESVSVAGLQEYLVSSDIKKLFHSCGGHTANLSEILRDSEHFEIFSRTCNLATISFRAMAQAYSPQGDGLLPNGLSPREICSIAKTLGRLDTCTAYFLPNACSDNFRINPHLVAQILWYITSEIGHKSHIPTVEDLEIHGVMLEELPLMFKYNALRDEWWFSHEKEAISVLKPCSEKDYNAARNGKISSRIQTYLYS